MDVDGFEDQVSITAPDSGITDLDSDGESSEVFSSERFRGFTANGMVRLEEDGREYGVIRKSFLDGMGIPGGEIDVVAVHRKSYSGASGQARLEAFRLFCQAVAEKRGGSANAKHGWYGGSRDEICDVVDFGFSSKCRSLLWRIKSVMKKKKRNKKQEYKFQYDPKSYALNFDDGEKLGRDRYFLELEGCKHNFINNHIWVYVLWGQSPSLEKVSPC